MTSSEDKPNDSSSNSEQAAEGTTIDASVPSKEDAAREKHESLSTTDSSTAASPPKGALKDRQNWWVSTLSTMDYLREISADKTLAFRSTDKLTAKLLGMAVLASMIFAAGPAFGLTNLALVCYVAADIVLLLGLSIFVISRFGIMRAMEPRFALMCWHLMIGTGLLTLTIGFNIIVGMILFIMKDQLSTLLQ